MTSCTLYFSSHWCSLLLSGCGNAAKHLKLSEQHEGNCFPEDTQSHTLLPHQKLDYMAETGVFSLEIVLEVLMSGGSRSGTSLTA